MTRRTLIGMVGGLAAVSLAAGAGALAYGHGGARHAIVRRMIVATIDEVLDKAAVTPAQREAVHAARDRVFAAITEARASRQGHVEEALALFESDQPDPARVEALHREGEAARAKVREAIHQAFVEAHDVLTPAQRKVVADWIRSHHRRHFD